MKTEYPGPAVALGWEKQPGCHSRSTAIVFVIIKNAIRNCKLENGRAYRALDTRVVYGPFIDFYAKKLMTILPILVFAYNRRYECIHINVAVNPKKSLMFETKYCQIFKIKISFSKVWNFLCTSQWIYYKTVYKLHISSNPSRKKFVA